MLTELITLSELLRDPQYRKFFVTVPKLPEHLLGPGHLPWKLLILKPGETAWRSKKYGTYQEAFAGLKKVLPKAQNAAINCRPLAFIPPVRTVRLKGKFDKKGKQVLRTLVWKPRIEADMGEHHWCPYCRRPSIFRMAVVSSKMTGGYYSPAGEPALRCVICGASERIVSLHNPLSHQAWDINKPRIY